jgi:Uma2 family endonuclease
MTVLEETQTIARLARMKEHLLLAHVTWETYDQLLDECEDRRLRHTYDRGSLEFMTRSGEHEVYKSLLGLFLVTLADELNLPLYVGGELTLRRPDLDRGLEPDQCFWIANEARVRGKLALDLKSDPPPDLFIEVEVSRSVLDRLAIVAALGVPEVWRFDGSTLQVGLLQGDGQYLWRKQSPTFLAIDLEQLPNFVALAGSTDHVSILRSFRTWVRESIKEPRTK